MANIIERLTGQELKHEYSEIKYTDKCDDATKESKTNFYEESCDDEEQRLGKCCCVQTMLNEKFESYGETILHLASRLGQADIVKILLEAGGNPSIK